jgi:hypothetical protein
VPQRPAAAAVRAQRPVQALTQRVLRQEQRQRPVLPEAGFCWCRSLRK